MKQLRYRLLIMLAALMLLPTGVGAAEAQKDLKIQDVFTVTVKEECHDGGAFQ